MPWQHLREEVAAVFEGCVQLDLDFEGQAWARLMARRQRQSAHQKGKRKTNRASPGDGLPNAEACRRWYQNALKNPAKLARLRKRTRIKARKRRVTHPVENAKACRKWLRNLKKDPVRYQAYLERKRTARLSVARKA